MTSGRKATGRWLGPCLLLTQLSSTLSGCLFAAILTLPEHVKNGGRSGESPTVVCLEKRWVLASGSHRRWRPLPAPRQLPHWSSSHSEDTSEVEGLATQVGSWILETYLEEHLS
jgi:hypothetical protein